MSTPFDPAKMGDALRNFFTNGGRPAMGPPTPTGNFGKSQQPPQPSYGPVSFQDALKALGPAMDNGQAYTNPQAYQGYQNAARAVGAMYGMQPNGYFNNARPEAFRPMPGMEQRPFNAQFRAQFPGQGMGPAPNPTVR